MLRSALRVAVWAALGGAGLAQGTRELFDGRSLDGWDGDPRFWSVEDGELVGRSSESSPCERTTWLVWRGGEVRDFELEFDFRLAGGNSGLQLRSRDLGEHQVAGYQADLEDGPNWTGCLYEQEGRGVLARRGEVVRCEPDGSRAVLRVADGERLLEHVRPREWNTYRVVARGSTIALAINGVPMTTLLDLDEERAARRGILAFQLHAGPPMEVRLRNVRLRELDAGAGRFEHVEPRTPRWIWTHAAALEDAADGEHACFRRTVSLEQAVTRAELVAAADNECVVTIDGAVVLECDDWSEPRFADVTAALLAGEHVLAIEAWNDGGPAGVRLSLDLELADGTRRRVVTDSSWLAGEGGFDGWDRPEFYAQGWLGAVELAPLGEGPWGLHDAKPYEKPRAAAADELEVPDGYRAELLYVVPRREQGSWVALCFDDRGRIVASDQQGPLYRVTLADGAVAQVEELPLELGCAQGLCHAFGALYAVVAEANDSCATGLWRAKAIDESRYAEPELLMALDGSGEHGPHAVVPDPREARLWLVAGNHTELPEIARSRVPRAWGEDRLLAQRPDPNGHAVGIDAPGGWILSVDPDGGDRELFACGLRNAYDLAFDDQGEIVTFDSDMEWDVGLPWYRPTRICHAASGAELGWRAGSAKWPAYYADSLPGIVDVGVSSPTGVAADRGGRFAPELATECGGAIFAADWAYGTIYAVRLQRRGASYSATAEPFVKGKPLALTDLELGPDGALYFLVGGRDTQSALYRIVREAPAVASVALRVERESARAFWSRFHGVELGPKLVERAIADLDDADRFVRFAARTALEGTDPGLWIARALAERRPRASIELLIALARCAGADFAPRALAKWEALEIERFDADTLLGALRALGLACLRLAPPDESGARRIERRLLALLPHADERVEREIVELLVFLGDARVIEPALARVETATAQEDRIARLWALRCLASGWTLAQRARFFAELGELAATTGGGNSYARYLANLREDALATLTDEERAALGARLDPPRPKDAAPAQPRPFVRAWTLDELARLAPRSRSGRDFARGERVFREARCAECHRFDGAGGGSGPDLTGVGSRFGDADVLEAIVEPSRTISDLYRDSEVVTTSDELLLGRLESLAGGRARVWPADGSAAIELEASEIAERRPHALSRMPSALLDTFGEDEVLDLLAYLRSGGDPDDRAFARAR